MRPGDVAEVARLHASVYGAEYGLDASFEAAVAGHLAELTSGGWPGPGEGLWMVETGHGHITGSITLNAETPELGRLGHLVLLPEARGRGMARRLVDLVLSRARETGYAEVELATFGELTAAARIYRDAGFVLASTERRVRWGREMDWQRYVLSLRSDR